MSATWNAFEAAADEKGLLKRNLYAAYRTRDEAQIKTAYQALKEYERVHSADVLDIRWRGDREAIVTWAFSFSNENDDYGGIPMTCVVDLTWQPEERDVGVGAGYIAEGDCPDDVLEYVAQEAFDRRADSYDERDMDQDDGY